MAKGEFVFALKSSLGIIFSFLAILFSGSNSFGAELGTVDFPRLRPFSSVEMAKEASSHSGLLYWQGLLWACNDNHSQNLHVINLTGSLHSEYGTGILMNIDWEELAEDDQYLYIGDFGNNAGGNRRMFVVYKIEKLSLLYRAPKVDEIHFEIPDYEPAKQPELNKTNFDFEAMLVFGDSLYLFSKEWQAQQTTIYSIPKKAGQYQAFKQRQFATTGMITGACWSSDQRSVVLCGYDMGMQPFLFLLENFKNADFFGGTVKRINLDMPFHQVEAICASNQEGVYYFTNQYLNLGGGSMVVPAQLHQIDLSALFSRDADKRLLSLSGPLIQEFKKPLLFPNPSSGSFNIDLNGHSFERIEVYNIKGQVVQVALISEYLQVKMEMQPHLKGLFYIRLIGNETEHLSLLVY